MKKPMKTKYPERGAYTVSLKAVPGKPKEDLFTIYQTKDLYEAAALVAANCQIKNLEPAGGFYFFNFNDLKTCTEISNAYWNNTLKLPVKSFADAIRSLKDRLFASKQREEG